MKNLVTYTPRTWSLFRNWDRVLDSFYENEPDWYTRTPSVDIHESEDSYTVEAELPGVSEKDLKVEVKDNLLTISTSKEEQKEQKNDKGEYIVKERRSHSFSRSFVLPRNVDRDTIHAEFKNGLLKVQIPRKEESKPRSIEVKSN